MRLLEDTSGVFYFDGGWHLALHSQSLRSCVHTWITDHVGKRGFYDPHMGIVPLDHDWAVKPGTTKTDTPPTIYFRHKRDALLFKLTWGGQDKTQSA